MRPLLAWSEDNILAYRSGYHVIADYLDADRVVTRRGDPAGGWRRMRTRLQRRFAFSSWFTGGSAEMETEVRKRCAAKPPSLLHLPWCDRDLGYLQKYAARQGIPLIGTFHQCPDELPGMIRYPKSLAVFAHFILMSDSQRSFFIQHGVSPERLHRVLHGVDSVYFAPESLDGPERFMVLAVGGTRRDFPQMKAVAEALAGVAEFVIVGPPDRSRHFDGMGHVSYRWGLTDEELLQAYRRASCFLHLAENATANNAMLEALACGAPVVSQRVGGIPEYLTGECSFLADVGDVVATVKSIKDLAGSRAMLSTMRHAAREHAVSLDWTKAAGETSEIYALVA
jgi:glycosyltransferase involved in cell wall biosynthesis